MHETPAGGYEGKGVRDSVTRLPSNPPTLWTRLRRALKQVAGMPDYARYLEHAGEHHPGCRVLSEREFYEQYIAMRYASGGSRCC